jgi:hypothetical protein
LPEYAQTQVEMIVQPERIRGLDPAASKIRGPVEIAQRQRSLSHPRETPAFVLAILKLLE